MRQVFGSDGNQCAMLVSDAQNVKTPERVIPSFVWVERVDSFYGHLRHALYFSTKVGRSVFRGGVSDGETSVPSGFFPVLNDKVMSQMIECTPKVLQHVSNYSTDRQRNIGDLGDAIGTLLRVQIILTPNTIGVFREKGIESCIQVNDMLVGPLGLY